MTRPVTITLVQSTVPKVYSYLRFSTPEQSKGDSRRRQTAAALEYAQSRGMTVDEELSDEGLSAFNAKHLADTGALGKFVFAAEYGEVAPGSILVVENIDRLSRLQPWRTAHLLTRIVQCGIEVVTLSPFREYTTETLDHESNGVMTFIELALQAHRAHSESVEKGRRGRAAWDQKRRDAERGDKITARCPPWLTLNADRKSFTVNEARAAIVRRIFRDTLAGIGSHSITAALNAEGVPPFSVAVDDKGRPIYSDDPKTTAKERARFWRRTYVATILKNPAVIGTQTQNTSQYTKDRTRTRVKAGEVAGYFPAIVSERDFLAVRAMQQSASPRRGRNAVVIPVNIFGGLARCGRCGATVVVVSKGKSSNGGTYHRSLVCERAKSGAGCRYTSTRLDVAEAAFIGELGAILSDAPLGDAAGKLAAEIEQLDAYLLALTEQLDEAFQSMQRRPSAETAQTLRRLESEQGAAKAKRAELEGMRAASSAPMIAHRTGELWDLCMSEPLDYAKVNAAMRRVFSRITFDFDSLTMWGTFIPSGESRAITYDPTKAAAFGFTDEGDGYDSRAEQARAQRTTARGRSRKGQQR